MILPTIRPKSLMRKIVHNTLHSPVLNKAILLLIIVVLGSTLCTFELSPETPFSDSRNPMNVYLVKLSWGWTLICIFPTILITSFLYTGFNFRVVLRHFTRLGIAHLIWLSVTTLFVVIDSYTGICIENEDILERSACIKRGLYWSGFDISGHIFLLTYCIYVITEECANIKLEIWDEYNGTLHFENRVVDKLTDRMKEILPQVHRLTSYFIDKLEILALTEILMWMVMVIATSLYFHSFAEKILGYVFGLLAWYLTYGLLYGRSAYLPCKPEEGVLHPLRHLRNEEVPNGQSISS